MLEVYKFIKEHSMPVAPHISDFMASSSFIRKMFEEGMQLKQQYGADKVFDFSIGNPDLEPPAKINEMLRELGESHESRLHAYMPNAGYPETRKAMAEKVSGEQGVEIPFTHIVMGCGAAGAMNSVLKAILSPGDEVLVSAPYFVEYGQYVRNHGGNLVTVPAREDFSLDIAAIGAALNGKTAAIIINSPNNPTGKIYSSDEMEQLGKTLEAHRATCGRTVMIISDEPYREITYNGKTVSPIFPWWKDTVVVSSFAKNLSLPGERIGYTAICPDAENSLELAEAVAYTTRILGFVNAPATFQRIVAACWKESVDYSVYEKRREILMEILDAAGIPFLTPEGAFYLFCRVPERKHTTGDAGDDAAFCDHLKKYRILAVPGRGFGKAGWIRLAYCISERSISLSRDAFIQAGSGW